MEEKEKLRQKRSAADKETVEEVAADGGDETVVVAKEVSESPEKKPTRGKKSGGRRRGRNQKSDAHASESGTGGEKEKSNEAETAEKKETETSQSEPETKEKAPEASEQTDAPKQAEEAPAEQADGASTEQEDSGSPEISEAAAVSSSAYKALELEVERYKAQVEEAGDRYKRLLAEFENARNRNEKESKRMYDIGAKEVLEKLLPVVDNFERALQAIPEEDKDRAFEKGVDQIYKQFVKTLDDVGVKPMNAEGTEFDPNLHNAVMHIEDEAFGENVVAEELQKGYMYKDTVLRHSMVKVAN